MQHSFQVAKGTKPLAKQILRQPIRFGRCCGTLNQGKSTAKHVSGWKENCSNYFRAQKNTTKKRGIYRKTKIVKTRRVLTSKVLRSGVFEKKTSHFAYKESLLL